MSKLIEDLNKLYDHNPQLHIEQERQDYAKHLLVLLEMIREVSNKGEAKYSTIQKYLVASQTTASHHLARMYESALLIRQCRESNTPTPLAIKRRYNRHYDRLKAIVKDYQHKGWRSELRTFAAYKLKKENPTSYPTLFKWQEKLAANKLNVTRGK